MKFSKLTITALLITAGLSFTSCKKEKMEDEPQGSNLMSKTYNYEFNNGQVVSTAAYAGQHNDDLMGSLKLEELDNGKTKITLTLTNTVNGQVYNVHAHDAADPTTTPNGTPYNETPNSSILVQQVTGNGGEVSVSQESSMSYSNLTSSYDGFLVVHDPLQAMSTTDISTYLIVGSFARTQTATGYMSGTFDYSFNTGQVNAAYTYSGTHANTLSGKVSVQELADGSSRVQVMLMNTINGETYMVHSHDMADPTTTPNGTPYNETPNSNVCVLMINGNGSTAMASQMSSLSYDNITTTYDGFFVVHDPLQAMTTTDPTTYVLLGVFAR